MAGGLVDPGTDLGRGQLAVAAGPDHAERNRPPPADQERAGGQQGGVGERTGERRLVAVGEHVAADVDEQDPVAAEVVGGGRQSVGDDRRTRVRVDQDGVGAEVRGDPRLGEEHAGGRPGGGAGERRCRGERGGVEELVDPPGTGNRVDGQPLPAETAEDGLAFQELSRSEGADHVAASADPDAEHALRVGEDHVGGASLSAARHGTPNH